MKITRMSGLVVATLVCPLAFAASAYAACAWVLWNEVTGAVGSEWILVQATTTAQQCETYLSAKVKDAAKSGKWTGGNIVTSEAGDKSFVFRFICVPDTIDPRGPKGK